MGCGRMRVSFNCSNFTFESCVYDLMMERTPDAMYSHLGAKTRYLTMTRLCDAQYNEKLGPNWRPKYGDGPQFKDWRYWYRVAPCMRCRNAAEICAGLNKPEPIEV